MRYCGVEEAKDKKIVSVSLPAGPPLGSAGRFLNWFALRAGHVAS